MLNFEKSTEFNFLNQILFDAMVTTSISEFIYAGLFYLQR